MTKEKEEGKIKILENRQKEALEFIWKEYFKAGYGSLNKSDVDLIFFTAVLRFSGDKVDSDYYYSKLFGITQQRIRNLREKMYLRYDINANDENVWEYLSEKIEYASYDKQTTKITIPIYDVNMFREIEHIVERDLKTVIDIQLNPKIFRISLNEFFDLILLQGQDRNSDNFNKDEFINKQISEIKKNLREKGKLSEKIEKQSLNDKSGSSFFINLATDLSLDFLKDIIPGGNISVSIIKKVIDLIKK